MTETCILALPICRRPSTSVAKGGKGPRFTTGYRTAKHALCSVRSGRNFGGHLGGSAGGCDPALPRPAGREDALTAFHGGRAMLRLGFTRLGMAWTEADVDAGYPVLLEAYRAGIATHTRLYPGAIEAVEALKAGGIAVSVCTNKPEGLAELLLTELGVGPSGRWSGRIPFPPVGSRTPCPTGRLLKGPAGWLAGRCWWGTPRRMRRPGWRRGCRVASWTSGRRGRGCRGRPGGAVGPFRGPAGAGGAAFWAGGVHGGHFHIFI